jgi:peptidoglycan/xylan/chitin deacetylase (PgdA/CDA1 family)
MTHPRPTLLLLCTVLLAACHAAVGPALAPTPTPMPPTTVASTATPAATRTPPATATPSPTPPNPPTTTPTRTLSPTPSATAEDLPIFLTNQLRPGVLPRPYLADPCFYLSQRWSPQASAPGTVVLPVMFHSIYQTGRASSDPKDISEEQFQAFVRYAHNLGFETITTAQLLQFLTTNAPIPPRSMILILDDRRPGVVRDHFLPVLAQYDWTLTLAYIADRDSFQWAMEEVRQMAVESGRLDVQSHGYSGQVYITEQTPAQAIRDEIWLSTPALAEVFGQTPLAFIWPGGNFTALAVQIAREGGYQVGFSAYSRGPLLFNWVPQGEPEQAIGDPLMLLPRAWSNSVNVNLDVALTVSEQAIADAKARYAAEASYARTYCQLELPPLENILP